MIKAIIFDLGGVVLSHSVEVTTQTLAELFKVDHKKAKDFLDGFENDWVLGKITAIQVAKRFKNKFKPDKSLNEIISEWTKIYKTRTQVNKKVMELILKLRENYKVYLFTNTTDIHHQLNSRRKIFKNFDKVYASFLIGKRKPNKDSYEHILMDSKIKPQDCIFIDDREINIKTAKYFKMQCILYKNYKDLIKSLKELGVK